MSMGCRVLYVDDEEDLRLLVQCQLTLEGYAADVAESGEAALSKLASTDYDVVLLDLHMPGMTGAQVAEEAHRRGHNAALVLLTGADPDEAQSRCVELGAVGLLSKPFHFSDLLASILQAVSAGGVRLA